MESIKKKGRPFKYMDEITRKESRRNKNRINQQRCRLKKKLHRGLQNNKTKVSFTDEYRNGIIKFHEQFEYDYFFTGTVDLNYLERKELKKRNTEISNINTEFNLLLKTETGRRISLENLNSYTNKFIQILSEKNLFERCFVVFEKGKYNKYHTHILFKSNPDKINFDLTSENSWLLGTQNITVPVFNKGQILTYMTKELKPHSCKNSDQKLIDSWFIRGDYNLKKLNIGTEFPKLKSNLGIKYSIYNQV
jgi:hypothetical protein